MTRAYFSPDGSYGDAAGLVVIDVSGFTEYDWEEIDQAQDGDRVRLAETIAAWRNGGTA